MGTASKEGSEVVSFENVSHGYGGGTLALSDITLRIRKGEFCVLLGPSGSGKTTLLNTANGLVMPTSGRVSVNGVMVSRKTLKHIRRQIGMIHQKLYLVTRLTVLENVLSGLLQSVSNWRALLKMFHNADQRRACALLESMELDEKHLYRRIGQLSGGEQQRVAIARAFIKQPSVVLADEPVASLDPAASRQVLKLLRAAAHDHECAVMCSLHQFEYAMEFADRIVALREGAVVLDAPPADLTRDALTQIYDVQPDEQRLSDDPISQHEIVPPAKTAAA